MVGGAVVDGSVAAAVAAGVRCSLFSLAHLYKLVYNICWGRRGLPFSASHASGYKFLRMMEATSIRWWMHVCIVSCLTIRRKSRSLAHAWPNVHMYVFNPRFHPHPKSKAAAAAASSAASMPAVSSGADIDTDELVDETGVEPKDIELIMGQVSTSLPVT